MRKKHPTTSEYDYMILIPVIMLAGLGLVAVFSASAPLAAHRMGDIFFYLKRQVMFCLLGFGLMIIAKNIPFTMNKKMVYLLLLINLCLLILLFVPGVGHRVGGACRWFRLWGEFSFQPSELLKFSLAIYMANSMSRKKSMMSQFTKGLLPHLLIVGIFMVLLVLQPDLGTAVIIGCWLLIVLFVGGVKVVHFLPALIMGALAFWWLVFQADYRIDRWQAFLDPWAEPLGYGYHTIHSFFAFGSGGIFGTGIGNSIQKLYYLPEAHTDFILAIIGEELGLLGVAIVLLLFGVLIIRGIQVAMNALDLYSTYLAFGLTSLIGIQAVINMGVVMGLIPTTGLTLPFISYGGSSLVFNFLSAGVLLNISSRILRGDAGEKRVRAKRYFLHHNA